MPDNLESRIERIDVSIKTLVAVVDGIAAITREIAELHKRLEMAQLATTEKLNALVQIVDEWIRRGPLPEA